MQDANYHRAYAVRRGNRSSILIPVSVLAATIRQAPKSALVEHLGPQMVHAIQWTERIQEEP